MKKLFLNLVTLCLFISANAQNGTNTKTTRQLWLTYMDKIARPVMENIANDKLKLNMPVELSERIDNKETRPKVAWLEAFGRTLSGIAPWLQLEGGSNAEIKLRDQYRKWALLGIS